MSTLFCFLLIPLFLAPLLGTAAFTFDLTYIKREVKVETKAFPIDSFEVREIDWAGKGGWLAFPPTDRLTNQEGAESRLT